MASECNQKATEWYSKLKAFRLSVQLPTEQAAQIASDASYANEAANGDNRIYGATSVRLLES